MDIMNIVIVYKIWEWVAENLNKCIDEPTLGSNKFNLELTKEELVKLDNEFEEMFS